LQLLQHLLLRRSVRVAASEHPINRHCKQTIRGCRIWILFICNGIN
jgi:hypothetical protein